MTSSGSFPPFAVTRNRRFGSPMLLKKSSSWPSLSYRGREREPGRGPVLPGAVGPRHHHAVRSVPVPPTHAEPAADIERRHAPAVLLGVGEL